MWHLEKFICLWLAFTMTSSFLGTFLRSVGEKLIFWLKPLCRMHSYVDSLRSRSATCPTQRSSLTSPSEAPLPAALWWSCALMWLQRLLRTSAACAQARRARASLGRLFISREVLSIVWSRISCAREETSRAATGLVANPSMVRCLQMRTLPSSTLAPESCRWLTVDPTPMDLNSSCAPRRLSGWMACMWCLAVWQTAWMLWRRLRPSAVMLAAPPSRWSLRNAANWHRNPRGKQFWGNGLSFWVYIACVDRLIDQSWCARAAKKYRACRFSKKLLDSRSNIFGADWWSNCARQVPKRNEPLKIIVRQVRFLYDQLINQIWTTKHCEKKLIHPETNVAPENRPPP